MADLNDHAEAWKTRLAAMTGVPVYGPDEVDALPAGQLPLEYLEVEHGGRIPGGLRLNNTADTVRKGWFVSIDAIGENIHNSRRVRGLLQPLLFSRLTIAGVITGPITLLAADDFPERNDGRWSQRSEWSYTHP